MNTQVKARKNVQKITMAQKITGRYAFFLACTKKKLYLCSRETRSCFIELLILEIICIMKKFVLAFLALFGVCVVTVA